VKYQKSTDAADGIGRNRTQGKGRPLGYQTDAITDRFHRMVVEMLSHPPGCAGEQGFDAEAEGCERNEQGQNARRPLAP